MSNQASGGSSPQGGSGNFANDPQKASEAGRKGEQRSHGGSSDDQASQRGGSDNFADDPQKTGEAGRKGGERSHQNR
jgi:general stress protein YciG